MKKISKSGIIAELLLEQELESRFREQNKPKMMYLNGNGDTVHPTQQEINDGKYMPCVDYAEGWPTIPTDEEDYIMTNKSRIGDPQCISIDGAVFILIIAFALAVGVLTGYLMNMP